MKTNQERISEAAQKLKNRYKEVYGEFEIRTVRYRVRSGLAGCQIHFDRPFPFIPPMSWEKDPDKSEFFADLHYDWKFANAVLDIDGVEDVYSTRKYELTVVRGGLFRWCDILPGVLELVSATYFWDLVEADEECLYPHDPEDSNESESEI